jgi:uncharacterized protein (DUF1697 family)
VTTLVAMLRGINVSGRNRLSMEDLRALVVAAGGRDVRTYIQSGNAVFGSRRSPAALATSLEKALEDALGTRVPVLVRTEDELEGVVRANPFVAAGEDPGVLHVTFLGAVPDPEAVATALTRPAGDDEFRVIGRQAYLRCPGGYGNTKLTNTFFERTLRSEATTRNWRTVTKLVELARG